MSMLSFMSTRLRVTLSEEEMISLRRAARRTGLSLSEWARRALRRARDEQAGSSPVRTLGAESRLGALERALACNHPTGDIDEILADIERGRDLR